MAYKRYLSNSDYYGIILKEMFMDTIHNREYKIPMAEQSAEAMIIENLVGNYEIEAELLKGKMIADYSKWISYPQGAFMWYEANNGYNVELTPHEVIADIQSAIRPGGGMYWDNITNCWGQYDFSIASSYSQFENYMYGKIIKHKDQYFMCLKNNGPGYNDIRVPFLPYGKQDPWELIEWNEWNTTIFELNDVVLYGDFFYRLSVTSGYDNLIPPSNHNVWVKLDDYSDTKEDYSVGDYVVYAGSPYKAVESPNKDSVAINVNVMINDPRNLNLKKHMTRIALFELSKNIAPNNISQVKVNDYEESVKWLSDCNKCKINPGIPRIKNDDGTQKADWAFANFQNPDKIYQNPWYT